MNNLKNNKGFSLVEILVALGVSSIILLGVATFMNASGNSYRVVTAQSSLQNETQDIINYMTRMVQGSSDAGWQGGIFYVLQPDALKAKTLTQGKNPNYIVHCVAFDKANQRLYYKKQNITNANFTSSTLNGLKNGLKTEDNIISNKVTAFECIVERYAAEPTLKPDGTPGTDAPDSRTQKLSKVDVTLEVFTNEGGHRMTKAAIRPRNNLTTKYFHQAGFLLESASAAFTPPTKVLARPNGDVKIGTDGTPSLH